MMTTETRTVEGELKKLTVQRRRLLKEFYYAVASALPQLAEELEFADLDLPANSPGPLLDQHNLVCDIMVLFAKIELGKTL